MKSQILKSNINISIMFLFMLFSAVQGASQIVTSQGPFDGKNFINSPIVGSSASWINPSNAQFYDGTSTSTNYSLNTTTAYTDYLMVTNFLFTIPANSVITGIEITVYKNSSIRAQTKDYQIQIVKNGIVSGGNHAYNSSWQGQSNPIIYGSSGDLWGEIWTSADIDSYNFGVAISVTKSGGGNNGPIPFIDDVQIKVYYAATDSNLYYYGNSGASLKKEDSSSLNTAKLSNVNINNEEGTLVVVYDILGREQFSKVLTIKQHNGFLEAIDAEKKLAPGIYVIIATNDNKIYRQKIIIE